MAHNCPECGLLCHCGGDIDDIQWDDDSEEAMHCRHYEKCNKDELDMANETYDCEDGYGDDEVSA